MGKQKAVFKTPLDYPNKTLSGLLGQIKHQKQLLAELCRVLPEPLASHVVHGLISDNRLLIYTDSAVWATQLRFYAAMMKQATEELTGKPMGTVQIRIVTDMAGPAAKKTVKPKIPSLATLECLHNDCLHVVDPGLQQALQKLSLTLKRLSS